MQELFWKNDGTIKLLLFMAVGALGFWVLSLNKQLLTLQQSPQVPQEQSIQEIDTCGDDCRAFIENTVAEAVATLSAQPLSVVVKTTTAPKQQVTYVPLNGDFSTRKTDWTDVRSSEVYVDLAEYSKDPYIDWEATVKAQSDRVAVRLYDITHGIAVNSSELESDSNVFTTVSSGQINFWSGKNLYRVQVKSLSSSEVFFSSGRIKIVSK